MADSIPLFDQEALLMLPNLMPNLHFITSCTVGKRLLVSFLN